MQELSVGEAREWREGGEIHGTSAGSSYDVTADVVLAAIIYRKVLVEFALRLQKRRLPCGVGTCTECYKNTMREGHVVLRLSSRIFMEPSPMIGV
jgi:hypothetical protein